VIRQPLINRSWKAAGHDSHSSDQARRRADLAEFRDGLVIQIAEEVIHVPGKLPDLPVIVSEDSTEMGETTDFEKGPLTLQAVFSQCLNMVSVLMFDDHLCEHTPQYRDRSDGATYAA
jgi:hypothetical protein